MNTYRKIANSKYEPGATWATRNTSPHGPSKVQRREKKFRNRVAKREEARRAFKDE